MNATDFEAEIARAPWIYRWRLRDGRELPIASPELPSIHETRAEMIEERVRAQLASLGGRATVLDLACNEGWFSHRALEWGAQRVLALDVRPGNIRRAELLRDHYEIPADRLEFRQADIFALDAARLGQFDVVLLLGLLYHVEDPMGALRLARACTRGLCVIETQVTRQVEPITHGYGRIGELHESEGSLAIMIEKGDNPLASTGRVLSFVPNHAALLQMVHAAGFDDIDVATARDGHNAQYLARDREIIFAT
jgi:tRNA (mo5U34)-methyltransferase